MDSPKSESKPSKLLNRVANLQFFTISFLLHVILVFALGTAVIVNTFTPPETFEASTSVGFLPPNTEPAGPQAEQPNEFTEVTYSVSSAPPAAPSASLSALATNGANSSSTWNVTAATDTRSLGTISQAISQATGSGSTAGGGGRGASGGLAGAMSTFFGGKEVETGLLGTFYDLKTTASGGESKMAITKQEAAAGSGVCRDEDSAKANANYNLEIVEFVRRGMKDSAFSKFFRAPVQLKSYQFYTPRMSAGAAPKAFEVADKVQPRRWAAVYRGVIRPPATGKYRFIGRGDDILVVKVGPKIVLDGSLPTIDAEAKAERILPDARGNAQYIGGPWITLNQNQTYPIDILFGETPGGTFYVQLFVEQEGKTFKGGPALFQTSKAELPKELAATREGLVFELVTK